MSIAPVLDLDALRRLGDELCDADVLCGFLRRYLALLEPRIERLERALAAGDCKGWVDAALSLQTSSAMAGAQALAEQVAAIRHDDAPPASGAASHPYGPTCRTNAMACLRALAAETARQLQAFLQTSEAAAVRPS